MPVHLKQIEDYVWTPAQDENWNEEYCSLESTLLTKLQSFFDTVIIIYPITRATQYLQTCCKTN